MARIVDLSRSEVGKSLILRWGKRPFDDQLAGVILDYLKEEVEADTVRIENLAVYATSAATTPRLLARRARQRWLRAVWWPALFGWFGVYPGSAPPRELQMHPRRMTLDTDLKPLAWL
jgi:hypothetical protein